ncbi:MAG: DNA internalization-related competence protein ComEC/Rec2 [Proteobacteria bacterium]|nr:DNA internalization-related competence protein ComEC/Rec2 [Pseudomonadota bacterium]
MKTPDKKTFIRILFSHRPVIPVLLSFMAGIGMGSKASLPHGYFFPLLSVAVVSVIASGILNKPLIYACALLFFLSGMLLIEEKISPRFPENHVIHFATDEKYTITGIIIENPAETEKRSRLIIRTEYLEKDTHRIPVTGNIRLTIMKDIPDMSTGDRLSFEGKLKPIRNFGNPGQFDYKRFMTYQGIWGTVFANTKTIAILEKATQKDIRHYVDMIRNHIGHAISGKNGSDDAKNVLKALITGDRHSISNRLRNDFNRVGAGHLLAISGLHVGIVASFSFFLFRWLLSFFPVLLWHAWTKKGAALIAFIPVVGYGLVSGMSPSTERAVIMVSVFLLSLLAEREQNVLNTLAIAALFILLLSPDALFSISFQMSFMAVLSICLGVHATANLIKKNQAGLKNSMAKKLRLFILVSFFAIAGTLPLTMVYFNQVSTIGLFTNLLLVPLFGFIVIPMGLLSIFFMPAMPFFSDIFIHLALVSLDMGIAIIRALAGLPFSAIMTITPTPIMITCYYLAFFSGMALLYDFLQKNSPSPQANPPAIQKKTATIILALSVLTVIVHSGVLLHTRFFNKTLIVTAIDVGQGSATLVRFPYGKTMLIDGGGFSDNAVFDVGKNIVAPFLLQNNIKTLDTVVLTHPESDHLNGLIHILDQFKVNRLITNDQRKDTYGYKQFQRMVHTQNISHLPFSGINRHQTINGVNVDILYPPVTIESLAKSDSWRTSNNASVVIKLTFQDISFLLPGDIMQQAEKELVKTAGDGLKSTVLFLPHHGSKTSSTKRFIDAVQPDAAIISAGWHNRFYMPSHRVLERLKNRNCRIFRTDEQGQIRMETDGKTLSTRSFY